MRLDDSLGPGPQTAGAKLPETPITTRGRRIGSHWLHPALCALFPPLLILSVNVHAYDTEVLLRPCLVSIGLAATLWAFLSFWISDARRTSLVVTATLLACYSFGPLHTLIGNSSALILIPYFVIVFLILRAHKHLTAWTSIANFTSLALVGLPLSNIWISAGPPVQLSDLPSPAPRQTAVPAKPLSDIYFVILDGYGRSDVLGDLYGLDNSAFLQQLRRRAFYVAGKSRSNYAQTKLSLASTLNLDYLDVLLAGLDPDTLDHRASRRLIRNNRLVRFFESARLLNH